MVKAIKSVAELEEEFKNAGSKAVLVDFHAQWCGPCKMIAPKIEEFSVTYSQKLVVLKVDVDEADDLAEKYEIKAMPTFILFKDGQKVNSVMGANAAAIESLCNEC